MKLDLKVHWVCWWTWLYVPGLMFLMALGMVPNWDKVTDVMAKAVRIRIKYTDEPKGSLQA